MNVLKNKVAIITGGSGGIGKATAKLFLAEGAKVMLVGRGEKKLKKAVDDLNNPNVTYCDADVSKAVDTKRYIDETLSAFEKIDIFFNNAGIEGVVKPNQTPFKFTAITLFLASDRSKYINGSTYVVDGGSNAG